MDSVLTFLKNGIVSNPPSITDWIGGFGTTLAIVAAIYSFIKLFTKDKEKQLQLQALSDLALNQAGINSTMSLQLKEQQKQTDILERYLLVLAKSEASKGKSIEIQAELADLEKRRRKADILPMFALEHGSRGAIGIGVRLRNIGKVAIMKRMEVLNPGDTTIQSQDIGKRILEGRMHDFSASLKDQTKKNWNPNFEVEFHFEDIDGNKYKQTFANTSSEFPISNPIEVL